MKELYEYKLELLYYGVSISERCYNSLKKGKNGKINNNDYITTKGLMIALDNWLYVNANLNPNSPYSIDYENNIHVLRNRNDKICKVQIKQPPEFALKEQSLPNGKLITELVNIHGDRIRIQPIQGCANHCKFCNINKFGNYDEHSIKDLDDSVQYAIENVGFKHALISGGTPQENNESYKYLNKVYKHFGEKYGKEYPIDIMMVPRGLTIEENNEEGYLKLLQQLKQWNISGVYTNLELYNDSYRKKYIPQKDSVGKEKYFKFIRLAVEVFGRENIKSCIIIGLEKVEDSLKAVEELSKLGCTTILSPYIPNDNETTFPKPELMKEVLLKSKEIVDKYNIELGPKCDSCRHNTIHFK